MKIMFTNLSLSYPPPIDRIKCAGTIDMTMPANKAISTAVQFVEKLSVPCSDDNTIAQVGTISSNGDKEIGNMILFPSKLLHQAKPVISGTRYVMTFFLTNEHFNIKNTLI